VEPTAAGNSEEVHPVDLSEAVRQPERFVEDRTPAADHSAARTRAALDLPPA
jgi:hypothetical protein